MKFFTIEEDKLSKMNELVTRKLDNEYVVLSQGNGYSDIAQYSCKYQNIHIVSVPTNKLDISYKLD